MSWTLNMGNRMKYMTSRAHHLRSCSMVKTDDRRVLSSINPIMLTKIQSPLNLLSPSFSIYIDPSRILGSKAASCSQFPWYSHPQDHEIEKSHVPTSHTTCRSYSSVHPAVETKRHHTSGEALLLLLQLLLQVGLLRVQALNPDTSTRVQISRKLVPDRT